MNDLDKLQDVLQGEIMMQSMYNKHMLDITNPEVRQLFTQMRDTKMQNVTLLQSEIQKIMQQGKVSRKTKSI